MTKSMIKPTARCGKLANGKPSSSSTRPVSCESKYRVAIGAPLDEFAPLQRFGPAPINRNRNSRDVTGSLGREKGHQVRKFLRRTHAAQRDLDFRMDFQFLQPLGSRVARTNVVDQHVERRILVRKALH